MVISTENRIPESLGMRPERDENRAAKRVHGGKRLTAALLILLAFGAHTLSAFADDGTPMGNFVEQSVSSGLNETEAQSVTEEVREVALSGSVAYSPDTQLFYYTVENLRFGISVPDGAIVTGAVRISPDASLTTALYRNGTELTDADLSCISESGKYILAVSENNALQEKRVNFTILSSPTGAVKEYILPTDFFLVSATLNGEAASASQTYVDLSSDGDYEISYRSPKADVDMQLAVTIDHTAPTATLSGIVDGKANGPVTVSDVEEGAARLLSRNGKEISYTDTISQTGSYTLTIRDAAGNETEYSFVVVTYANTSLKALISTGIVLLLALVGYIIFCRKYNRVR